MIIGSKSTFKYKEIKAKADKGAKYIEFHTVADDFKNEVNFEEIKNSLKRLNMTAYCVHSPMGNFFDKSSFACALGFIDKDYRENNMYLYKKSIEAAAKLCNVPRPIVVVHVFGYFDINDSLKNNLTKEDINRRINALKEDARELNDFIEKNYPNVILALENNVTIATNEDDTLIGCYFGKKFDLPEIVEEINLPHIKTILDTCHAQNVINSEFLFYAGSHKKDILSINDYIERYKNTLALFHLSNCIGFGLNEKHGYYFDSESKEDVDYLVSFFKKLKEINYQNPITLEIIEKDYLNCTYYERTNKAAIKAMEIVNEMK